MQIRLIKNVTALGSAGTVRSVDAPSGRALVVLGMAVQHVEPPKPEVKKRTYKRKDIVPEPVIEVEEPQPMPEPEVEPEVEPEPETEEDEDAAVRLGD